MSKSSTQSKKHKPVPPKNPKGGVTHHAATPKHPKTPKGGETYKSGKGGKKGN